MIDIETLHHVSLPVTDLARATRFYREVLGLAEIARPPFAFAGAWFALGDRQLHLIVNDRATTRGGKGPDSRDIHFAVRVRDFRGALAHLEARGFRADAPDDDPMRMKVNARATAGFPQIFIVDPDRNTIEINAERAE